MSLSEQPLNVWSRSDEEIGRLMSNFAHTPFTLDGVQYASVEAFYASLLVVPQRRERVRKMYGVRAKHEIPKVKPRTFEYCGEKIGLGTAEHIALIQRAIRAKLSAHPEVASAFVATRPRPIAHETGYEDAPDVEFPKAVLCRVLTELRDEFASLG
jgi:predicted NAD-dependent protein-ADP-ribosyltransferase YbiA (DUF1768 family)